MNPDQNLAALRSLLTALGPLAVTLGLLKADQLGPLVEATMTIAGALLTVGGFVWSWWAHRHDAQIAAAARSIEAKPTLETVAPIAAALRNTNTAEVMLTPGIPTNAELAAAKP